METLLLHVSAFPQVLTAIPEFTATDLPKAGSRTFFGAKCFDGTISRFTDELYILLNYAEPNRNSSDPIPWSIRRQLLYQSFDAVSLREKSITIRPSEAFKSRITEELMQRDGIPCHWTNLPLLLVGSLPAHWSPYARFLDKKIWYLVSLIDTYHHGTIAKLLCADHKNRTSLSTSPIPFAKVWVKPTTSLSHNRSNITLW
jgi:hypothetical protein